ncbi:MAG: LytTR family DNA-binding domain-containing protein [Bacteroidaceae bacterium]|nr:LytTR family DNA-binding domain-containing protein [Bacteroidaceae bacterium]
MINNPILHNSFVRLHHMLLCILLGACYAISFGLTMHISALGITGDALVSMVLLFAEAIMLWNIFMYSRLEILNVYQSVAIHFVYVIAAAAIMVGGELLIMSIISPNDAKSLVSSIPARVFSFIVIYISFRRYYTYNQSEEDDLSTDIENVETADKPITQTEVIERITIKVGTKIKVIPVTDIIYLKAEDDYVSVVTTEGHWLKSERLKDFETSLPCNQFARVHRSYIVNVSKITKIERYGQKQMLSLTNNEQIRISMTGYKVLKEILNL